MVNTIQLQHNDDKMGHRGEWCGHCLHYSFNSHSTMSFCHPDYTALVSSSSLVTYMVVIGSIPVEMLPGLVEMLSLLHRMGFCVQIWHPLKNIKNENEEQRQKWIKGFKYVVHIVSYTYHISIHPSSTMERSYRCQSWSYLSGNYGFYQNEYQIVFCCWKWYHY